MSSSHTTTIPILPAHAWAVCVLILAILSLIMPIIILTWSVSVVCLPWVWTKRWIPCLRFIIVMNLVSANCTVSSSATKRSKASAMISKATSTRSGCLAKTSPIPNLPACCRKKPVSRLPTSPTATALSNTKPTISNSCRCIQSTKKASYTSLPISLMASCHAIASSSHW